MMNGLPHPLGFSVYEEPNLPPDMLYVLPGRKVVHHPSLDWEWQVFLYQQRQIGRRYIEKLADDACRRLGLTPPDRDFDRRHARIMADVQMSAWLSMLVHRSDPRSMCIITGVG